MTKSALAKNTYPVSHYNTRQLEIDTITLHHMAGNLTNKRCAEVLENNNASTNYGIDSDGNIACFVEEQYRTWSTTDWDNDNRAINVEIANDEYGGNWHVSDASIEAAINLCVDICKRYNFPYLNWTGDASGRLTVHNMFMATACPGPYLQSKMPYIAEEVTRRLKGEVQPTPTPQPDPTPVEPVEPTELDKYTDVQLATLVWKGTFGSGQTRINKLGDRYKAVQTLVDEYVGQDPKSDVTSKALAKEVWDGLWGTGQARFKALDDFGYDSDKVQYWVNETAPSTPTPAPKPTPIKSITVGSKVVVTNPVDWYGTELWIDGVYDVIEVSGNRIVIGKGSVVTAAIHKDNLKLV